MKITFDKLVLEHAAEEGWARNPDLLYDTTATKETRQHGTGSIKARIAHHKELKIARRNAALAIGAEPEQVDTVAGRKSLVTLFCEWIKDKQHYGYQGQL